MENQHTWKKLVLLPFCPPQIPHALQKRGQQLPEPQYVLKMKAQ